jgi:hypothetical protein
MQFDKVLKKVLSLLIHHKNIVLLKEMGVLQVAIA